MRKTSQTQDLAEIHHCISNIPMKLLTQDYWERNTEFWIVFILHTFMWTAEQQGRGKSLLTDPSDACKRVIKKLITKAHVLSEGSRVLIIYGVVFSWKKPVCLHEWSWLQEIVLTESSHILNVKSAVENKRLVYWMLFVISWQFQMAIKMPFWLFVPFCDGSRFFWKGLCEGKKGLT